jgi:uncharacterized repeat protein (TIGR01451 family)
MNTHRPVGKRYRQILLASVLSTGSLLAILPALADQNTATGGSTIENQATAEFTDSADTSASPGSIKIVSDIVKVTVLEVAGIAIGNTPSTTGIPSRGNTINVEFKVYNTGNDPTKIFIPAKPSVAKLNSVDLTAAQIGQLKVVKYTTVKADGTDDTSTTISSGNTIDETSGTSTADLTGLTGGTIAVAPGGSIPAGAYITVQVPITIPQTAVNGDKIKITLGNTGGTDTNNAAKSTTTNDLYTVDNSGTANGDVDGSPNNGEREASKSYTIDVVGITISGTVWNDKDKSGTPNATTGLPGTIFTTGESGTDAVFGTSNTAVKAVLIDITTTATPKVVAFTTVDHSTGAYSFTSVPPSKTYQVLLVPTGTTVTDGSTTVPAAALPADWVATAPITTADIPAAASDIDKNDFGIRQKAKLVLAKRITKIIDTSVTPNTTTNFNNLIKDTFNFDQATHSTYPANYVGNWPTTPDYLVGKTDGGNVKPGDEIEYTIYFLNNQGSDAKNIKICDRIRGGQTYVADSLYVKLGSATTETHISDSTNTFGVAGATTTAPTDCNSSGTTISTTVVDNGGVWIAPGNITGATAVGAPNTSYGYFKFRTKVKQ